MHCAVDISAGQPVSRSAATAASAMRPSAAYCSGVIAGPQRSRRTAGWPAFRSGSPRSSSATSSTRPRCRPPRRSASTYPEPAVSSRFPPPARLRRRRSLNCARRGFRLEENYWPTCSEARLRSRPRKGGSADKSRAPRPDLSSTCEPVPHLDGVLVRRGQHCAPASRDTVHLTTFPCDSVLGGGRQPDHGLRQPRGGC